MNTQKLAATVQAIAHGFCTGDGARALYWSMQGVEASVRADTAMPAASVAKVAIVLAALKKITSGALDGGKRVAVRDLTGTRYCSILQGFDADATLSMREVCRLALMTSDNPLSVYLSTLVSNDEATAYARRIGVSDGFAMSAGFSDPELGLPNRANVMTAKDAALLVAAAAQNADAARAMRNNLRGTRIPRLLPESAIVTHKTGSLNGVVNDAGVIEDNGRSFVLAILTDNQADTLRTEAEVARCALAIYDAVMTA